VGCCIVTHDDRAEALIQAQCRRQHRVVVVFSHDAQWAREQQVLLDYTPWEHNQVARLVDLTLELELEQLVVPERAVYR
jgi:hypothetical protein